MTRMKVLFAVLYVVFSAAASLGQTSVPGRDAPPIANPMADRADRLSKQFPPDIVMPAKGGDSAKVWGAYCIHPTADKRLLTIERCRTSPSRLRLVPLLEVTPPAARPAKEPANIAQP